MGEMSAITAKVNAIEGDLSVIMQMLRVAASTDGYEITSAGLDELCGMIFAVSLRVSALGLDISSFAGMNRDLLKASRAFMASVRRDEGDIADLVQLARQSVRFAEKGDPEGWLLLERCLQQIDQLVMPKPVAAETNVVPFARPVSSSGGVEGGAA